MNQWYFVIGILVILLLLIIGIIICTISLIIQKIRKRSKKRIIIAVAVNVILLITTILYEASHGTYYKYNDWAMVQSNIYEIEQQYGAFDFGEIKKNQKGRVAYYTYTDNGPIMPDHQKHYYYLEYDEQGIVYEVYDGLWPGG